MLISIAEMDLMGEYLRFAGYDEMNATIINNRIATQRKSSLKFSTFFAFFNQNL